MSEKISKVYPKIIDLFEKNNLDLTEISFILKSLEYEFFYKQWFRGEYEKLFSIDKEIAEDIRLMCKKWRKFGWLISALPDGKKVGLKNSIERSSRRVNL